MNAQELFLFIRTNLGDEQKCIETIEGCFLREQLNGIRATNFARQIWYDKEITLLELQKELMKKQGIKLTEKNNYKNLPNWAI